MMLLPDAGLDSLGTVPVAVSFFGSSSFSLLDPQPIYRTRNMRRIVAGKD
jgi:hypothetical protein